MRLTAKNAKTLPVGLYRLDRGIYLRVTETSRFWILKVQKDGKRREFGLGGVNQPIETVRNTASKIKTMLLEGKDPVEVKEEQKPKQDPLFTDYSVSALGKTCSLRKWSEGTMTLYSRINRLHLIPKLGSRRMSQITIDELIEALTPLWIKANTANVALQTVTAIMDSAFIDGFSHINAGILTKTISTRLPSKRALRKASPVKHMSALSAEDLRDAVKKLQQSKTLSLKCVLFGILTVGRVSEYRLAKWSEIDFEKGVFSVPPDRRKDKKPEVFQVPLSSQAQDLLKQLPQKGEYVFSAKGINPISKSSMNMCYHRVLEKKITLHGSRSTFSDWCAKNNKNFLVSEKCLMHSVGNTVFMAYQRDDLFDQRRTLLQEWADYLYS